MPPDHDHLSGRVVRVGPRRMPDRETGAQADWIVCQLQRYPQLPWLVPMRPQPWSLTGLTAVRAASSTSRWRLTIQLNRHGAPDDFGSDGYTETGTAACG
jgi:hypothetical protein